MMPLLQATNPQTAILDFCSLVRRHVPSGSMFLYRKSHSLSHAVPTLSFEPLYTLGNDVEDSDLLRSLNNPIGCSYIEVGDMRRFLVCDTEGGHVRVYDDDRYESMQRPSKKPQVLTNAGPHKFDKPSAVVVSRSGEIFAVKDERTIQVPLFLWKQR